MSGLLRPVGPEAAQTYWARRGLVVLGATMVLAVAVALIISGTSSGSAVQANPSPSTAGYPVPSSASPSSMQTAMARHRRSTLGFSHVDDSRAGGHHAESVDEEDRSERPVDCPAEELRPTLTGKQRLAPKKPTPSNCR